MARYLVISNETNAVITVIDWDGITPLFSGSLDQPNYRYELETDEIYETSAEYTSSFDFFKNEMSEEHSNYEDMNEGKKKTGTPLCARGKSAAKSKFKVYPSAYANGYAVQVCKGKIKGLDGKKHCSGAYC
jgi:hypothetical protein